MSHTRRAYRTPKAGSLKRLQIVNESLADPAAGEVQIAVKAIGLNFADIFAIKGLYSATPKGSFVPGLEVAGTITQVGQGVTTHQVGDRVMAVTRFGGYTDTLNVGEEYAMPLPEGWSFSEGAAFPVQVLTAYHALFPLADLKEGQTVLIQSAAGGVGILANRLAKTKGAYTIGTVSSDSKFDLLKAEGYDQYFVRDPKNHRAQIEQALDGRRLDVVLETIGGKVFLDSFAALSPMGRLVSFGSARFSNTGSKPNLLKAAWQWYTRPKVDPMQMTTTNRSLMAFNLIYLYEQRGLLKEYMEKIMDLKIGKPHVGHSFSFEELHQAVTLFSTGKTRGKVVVLVGEQA